MLTNVRETKLPADHSSVKPSPEVVAHGAPHIVVADLNSTSQRSATPEPYITTHTTLRQTSNNLQLLIICTQVKQYHTLQPSLLWGDSPYFNS